MITRRRGIIIITGSSKEDVLPVLRNHEALIQIKKSSEIMPVWKNNKTPIVDEKDLLKVCGKFYEGNIFVFDTDEQNIFNDAQEEITEKITKFCYNVQIEPGEFKVKNVANNNAEGCIFCEITQHPGKTTYTHNLGCKFVDMIIYESKNFVVVPGLGPLAPGYLMIMTKDHYLSLAQIPQRLVKEYKAVEEHVEEILSKMYNKPICFFEHGTGPRGAVGLKSIVHMHIRVMLDNVLSQEYLNMFSMKKIDSITESKDSSYFWYKCGTNGEEWIVDDPDVYIQRQAHRQIYAEEHNFAKDQFNWRKTAFEDLTKTNVWQLYKFLQNCQNPIIRERTANFVEAAKVRFEEE